MISPRSTKDCAREREDIRRTVASKRKLRVAMVYIATRKAQGVALLRGVFRDVDAAWEEEVNADGPHDVVPPFFIYAGTLSVGFDIFVDVVDDAQIEADAIGEEDTQSHPDGRRDVEVVEGWRISYLFSDTDSGDDMRIEVGGGFTEDVHLPDNG